MKNLIYKFVSIIAATFFLSACNSSVHDYENMLFKDVAKTDWYYPYVTALSEKNAVEGYGDGLFHPYTEMTRAEYIKMAVCAVIGEQPIAETYWADNYIEKAAEYGIIDRDDYPDGEFDKPITRNRMAKIAVRCVGFIEGIDVPYDDAILLKYESAITDFYTGCCQYCRPYIATGYDMGLFNGFLDGTFRGYDRLNRAEACVSILRIIDKSQRLEV